MIRTSSRAWHADSEIAHLGCRDRAPLAVAHERPVHDVFQLRRDVGPQRSDGRRRRRQHRVDERQRVRALERRPTGQHLVRDDAERPEIRPCVHRFAGGLFGRHVAGRAHRAAGARELRRRLAHLDLREPEVEDFHLSRRRQHQVRRLEIAVDDAGGVCGVERVGHLRDDAGDLGHRQRPAGEASRQRFALVVRHRDERLAGVVADLVDRRDVGMIERAGGARLPQQAGSGFRTDWRVSG